MNTQLVAPLDEVYRLGYSPEVYEMLEAAGLRKDLHVLDVGCGIGLASDPLSRSGRKITGVDLDADVLKLARERMPEAVFEVADAHRLPFENATFDAAISAQTFHWFDRAQAIGEMKRVVKPDGVLAIWWKALAGDAPLRAFRDQVARDCGLEPIPDFIGSGFGQFYAAGLTEPQLRIVPWKFSISIEAYVTYERARAATAQSKAAELDRYAELLRERVTAVNGTALPLIFPGIHYLYYARNTG